MTIDVTVECGNLKTKYVLKIRNRLLLVITKSSNHDVEFPSAGVLS